MDKETKTEFSPEQRAAIDTRDRTLLVSAAAGSGKTTTLTQRIIESLIDDNDPISLQDMLIVTFTNASVYDLKEKISKALRRAVKESKDNKRLLTELYSLDWARIQTIDSFCAELVRANAERLGITPSYRICESAEMLLLERSVMDRLIERIFDGECDTITPKALETLSDALTGVKRTGTLTDTLIALYEKTKSSVKGVDIFLDIANNYLHFAGEKLEETVYGKYAIKMTRDRISYRLSLSHHYEKILNDSTDATEAAFAAMLSNIKDALTKILETGSDDYDTLRDDLNAFSFPKAPSYKGEKPAELLAAIEYRQKLKNDIDKCKSTVLSYTRAEWSELYRSLASEVTTLHSLLTLFSDNYFEQKKKRGCLEFSDTERLAYGCLWNNGELTDIALGYRSRLRAVYIDEYQDVNELQNKIFEAVSPERGRFMVGDIKQSIYGFRSARPEIFADMKKSFPPLASGEAVSSSIFMSNNYRCDKGIVDFVNEVFDRLFGLCADSIGYVSADRLNPMKTYKGFIPEIEKPTVALISENNKRDEIGEAPLYVAKKIKELIKNGTRRDGSALTPRDFAIILRTKKRMGEYESALRELGIASVATENKDFFLNPEILLTISFLSAIDNPRRDIHLTSVMCSPIFGFTADEIYLMRRDSRRGPLFDAVLKYSKEHPENKKLVGFLETLHHYRILSEGMSVDELISRIYHESGLFTLAAKHGGRENLRRLYSYARGFEGSSYKGLYNFLSYISNVIESGETIDKKDSGGSTEDAVHIGTIHSAKGLEFPVVFLAEATAQIINLDEKEKIAFNEDLGISFLLRSKSGLALVEQPIHHILHDYMNKKHFEEIIRLLYVALTRPKEKLYIVGALKDDIEEYLEDMSFKRDSLTEYSLRELNSYMDMILASGADAEITIVKNERAENDVSGTEQATPIPDKVAAPKKSGELLSKLKERFSFVYENEHLTRLPQKLSVSVLHPSAIDENEDAPKFDTGEVEENEERELFPAFIRPDPVDISAKRGIATHTFMQFFDVSGLIENGVETELSRLRACGYLSEENASLVRVDELRKFASSELILAMRDAETVYREFRFNTTLPASLFSEEENADKLYEGCSVLVQGVIDCLIVGRDGRIRLVDYKTDRLTAKEKKNEALAVDRLKKKHSLQLYYYALAVEKIFGKEPDKVEVYSLALGKVIDMQN